MNKADFFSEIARITEADPAHVREETALSDIPGWDSMATMSFLAMVDKRLGIVLDPSKLLQCRTIGDLMGLVGSKIEE